MKTFSLDFFIGLLVAIGFVIMFTMMWTIGYNARCANLKYRAYADQTIHQWLVEACKGSSPTS